MKKVAVITGTRAEYGYLRPLIQKLESNHNFDCLLYVTGMHLLKEYGYSLKEIEQDGFDIYRTLDMKVKPKNTPHDMAVSTGEGVKQFADAFNDDKPDLIIVFGDRIEPLSAAIAASIMNIPVAHIGGGDRGFADIDNTLRHAITKLSHIHFTNSKKSMECVLQLGEEPWRVHFVGALSLDTLFNERLHSKKEILDRYNVFDKDYLLVVYHPITTEWRDAGSQMKQCMQASAEVAKDCSLNIIAIYPNAYAGSSDIIDTIKKYEKDYDNIYSFMNMPHIDYLSLLANTKVLVGNSSSGVIEAPSLHIPVVNIGTRQMWREKAENVIDVGYDEGLIKSAIKKSLFDEEFREKVRNCRSPYEAGKASERIVKVLSEVKMGRRLLQKQITY